MKNIKKLLYLLVLLLLPAVVNAAGSVSVNPTNITIDQGGTASFSVTANNAAGKINITSSNASIASVTSLTGVSNIQAISGGQTGFWDSNTGTVQVRGVAPGTTTIRVVLADVATYDAEALTNSYNVNITVNAPKSSNNNLRSLTVNGSNVSGFSASTTTYNIGTVDSSSVSIFATAEDSGATVSGTGARELKYGNNSLTVSVKAANGDVKNYVINVNRPDNRSSDNYLSDLKISEGELSFSRTNQKYNVVVDNSVSSIRIDATANDSKATVSGAGNKTLKVYANSFTVTVTAENGQARKYTLNVTRRDENGQTSNSGVSNDSTLKDLSVEGYSLGFSPSSYEYSLDVASDVDSINVGAVPNHDKATVAGVGLLRLEPGENHFTITVTSEAGDYSEYFLNVNRLNAKNIPSSLLNYLSINDVEIDVNGDSKTILYGVDSSVSSLQLVYRTSSSTSKFEVTGGDKLSVGINVVTIKVSDEGSGENTYYLLVNKSGNEDYVNTLSIDSFTSDVAYNSIFSVKLKKSLLDSLKKTDYKLLINNVNNYNGLLYSVQFDKNVEMTEDTDLDISKIGNYEKSVVYGSNIPKNAVVKLHVDDKLKDKEVYLYSFNMETKKYILLKDKEKINNEYISFKSDGSNIYLLSEKKITDKTFILQLILYLLFFIFGILVVLTAYVFYKKGKLDPIIKKIKKA